MCFGATRMLYDLKLEVRLWKTGHIFKPWVSQSMGGRGEKVVFYDIYNINASKHIVNEKYNVLLMYLEAASLLIATNNLH